MRLFDPRAALAEIEKQPPTPATSATSATQPTRSAPYVAKVADVAAPSGEIPDDGHLPTKRRSAGGRSLTWTGRVVSLQEWRNLTEYERNGPSIQANLEKETGREHAT